jgi:hypothetical protein
MKRSSLSPGLGLALLIALPALAQPPEGPPQGRQDGPPPGRGLFISPCGEPFRSPDGLRAWFDGADADHDGGLTVGEFRADAMRFFKVVDANGDGVVDSLENRAYETRIAPEIIATADREDAGPPGRGAGGPGGDGMGPPPRGGPGGGDGPPRKARAGMNRREGAARFGLLNEPQPVRGADADLDWKVTADEWARAATRRFALLDTAQTGRLALETLPPPGGLSRPPRK